MPIRLVHGSNDTNPMEVTLDDFEQAVKDFEDHYSLEEGSHEFTGADYAVEYDDLEACITDFADEYDVNPEDIGVRFIHCFNPEDQVLYMRMQLCTMQATDDVIDGHRVYSLNLEYTAKAWFSVTEGTIAATEDYNQEDESYRNSFYYKTPDGSYELLADGTTFVNSLTYPWYYEIQAMYTQNGSPDDAKIHFASGSYLVEAEGEIPWPHGLIMYLEDADGDIMMNDNDYISMFTYKGADFGTACPPHCNVYIAPTAEPF